MCKDVLVLFSVFTSVLELFSVFNSVLVLFSVFKSVLVFLVHSRVCWYHPGLDHLLLRGGQGHAPLQQLLLVGRRHREGTSQGIFSVSKGAI